MRILWKRLAIVFIVLFRMPGAYARLRPESRLSAGDIKTICTAAH